MTNPSPWSVRIGIDQVSEAGRQMTIEADAEIRQALAEQASLTGISRLTATFQLTRHGGDKLRVAGRVKATVGQLCILTLEPITNEIDEPIDLLFLPEGRAGNAAAAIAEAALDLPVADNDDIPEIAPNGVVDLGGVATEFMLLGVDPYPRKPGVVFEAPAMDEEPAKHPFAALAALKGRQDPERNN
jgi:uncharacterized metal-binding protein YceD (DUF177 family)